MTDHAIPATAISASGIFGYFERQKPAAAASLFVLNIVLLLAVLAVLWTPAVLFWAALLLAPTALVAIIGITLGLWM